MSAIADAAAVAPAGPGVYCFLDDAKELLYVGKAGDLRRRLRQHARSAATAAAPRDVLRHDLVAGVRWEECADEVAAAAREADLIVAFRPLLNASHATEGRWVQVVAELDAGAGTVRLRLVPDGAPVGDRVYGCFPHLGVGVSSRHAIACSEGYAAFVRLLWAAGEGDVRARYPRAIAGPSPPSDVTVPFDDGAAADLHRLLSGTSARLLDSLLAASGRRPAFMQPALRRDHTAAGGFFTNGPRAVRALRLRHRLPPGPLDRDTWVNLLASELRASIGDFELPHIADPTGGVLGERASRAHGTRAALRGRR